ncbi:MAG: hypothetical protein FJ115_11005 [Deltaproteobacteria bacterium]|nr:hypothetical protein [Deltaproteobacteria bacterium]MBM4324078.1 hypothetical protein [Deltaproteobacteria bacterium]
MKRFLSVVGPLVGNFIVWALITRLPVHPTIIFALVIMSGVLMICAMSYFRGKVEKALSTQGESYDSEILKEERPLAKIPT